eukprot:Phypoly_transcript_05334.p1 GENE.Phypoly_transcript_05334~~Phypoly_transcript_05334.p1  ORF type:complete len:525 (-),score=68.09 Phypoly_transcript_05334:321-1895(-)
MAQVVFGSGPKLKAFGKVAQVSHIFGGWATRIQGTGALARGTVDNWRRFFSTSIASGEGVSTSNSPLPDKNKNGEAKRTIAIVGGGASGALVAYQLLRRSDAHARVVLIDPHAHESLGRGLAYSTPIHKHLLNVPAGKITALPEDPAHFLRWLRENHDANATGECFAPRPVFGTYIHSLLSSVSHKLDHRASSVTDCRLAGAKATLRLADGGSVEADAVVLATGNFDPALLPGIAQEAITQGVYCHSAWAESTFSDLDKNSEVALIGTGLTAVDALLRLRETGHRGRVLALSRHSVFPFRHAPYTPLKEPIFYAPFPNKARELLRGFHQAIASGMEWRAVVDSLRAVTNDIWLALPVTEQKRFNRHLRHRWEVARHRMAPQIAESIDAELAAGTLVRVRGSLHSIVPANNGAKLCARTRSGEINEYAVARVINCTGPSNNYARVGSPLFASLFAQGLATPGPLGACVWTNADGALRNRDGGFSDVLFLVGPGRQGTLLESIAIPEIHEQAADMAQFLTTRRNEA